MNPFHAAADATRKLDELCAGLDEAPPAAAERGGEQHDIKIHRGPLAGLPPRKIRP